MPTVFKIFRSKCTTAYRNEDMTWRIDSERMYMSVALEICGITGGAPLSPFNKLQHVNAYRA